MSDVVRTDKNEQDETPPTELIYSENARLFFFAISSDWPAVLELARTDPKQTYTMPEDYGDETPLYWACTHNAPLEVLKTLVEAAPHTARMYSHWTQQAPIEALLQCEPHSDTKEKVLTLCHHNNQGGKACLDMLRCLCDEAIQGSLKHYTEDKTIPTDPFAFLDDTMDIEATEGTTPSLTKKKKADIYWNIFVLIVKIAHYGSTAEIDCLPLLPAMMSLDSRYLDADGDTLQFIFPVSLFQFALRTHPQGVTSKDEMGKQFALHKAVANSSRALTNEAIMQLFSRSISLLKTPDAKSGLYPFMLAAAASHDFHKGEFEVKERADKARAIRKQRMEDGRAEALKKFGKTSGDKTGEAFEEFLFDWIMEGGRCDDLMDDLYADSNYRFEEMGESEYEEHLMKEKDALKSFELSFRLLHELPEVLQHATATGVSDHGSEKNKKTRIEYHGEKTGKAKKHRVN